MGLRPFAHPTRGFNLTDLHSSDRLPASMLDLLRCPETDTPLVQEGNQLRSPAGSTRYEIGNNGIPIFAAQMSRDASIQQEHYQEIAAEYIRNLAYPHTEEYMAYLDRMLLEAVDIDRIGTVAELCCGHGEAFKLLDGRAARGVGVDISVAMLEEAVRRHGSQNVIFVQGDVTRTPLAANSFDAVFMLGGIHHVNDRTNLFKEIHRMLKPGGKLYFREPVDDFFLWRWIRAVVYRLAPALDHKTERPLQRDETISALENAGLRCSHYRTHGFLGFCIFMNSDVLVFNRVFRFVPGIRWLTRMTALLDEAILRLPGFRSAGLQVVGVAEKPADANGTALDPRYSAQAERLVTAQTLFDARTSRNRPCAGLTPAFVSGPGGLVGWNRCRPRHRLSQGAPRVMELNLHANAATTPKTRLGMLFYYLETGPFDPTIVFTLTVGAAKAGAAYAISHSTTTFDWLLVEYHIYVPYLLVLVAVVGLGRVRPMRYTSSCSMASLLNYSYILRISPSLLICSFRCVWRSS
jgi:SAM-dependent methyltransferase